MMQACLKATDATGRGVATDVLELVHILLSGICDMLQSLIILQLYHDHKETRGMEL